METIKKCYRCGDIEGDGDERHARILPVICKKCDPTGLNKLGNYERAIELCKGCVVIVKRCSGISGYGNHQCVSWYSKELGELSLYGHNQHIKKHEIQRIISFPIIETGESRN